jgi:membrane fusion protein, multidrug efflux system
LTEVQATPDTRRIGRMIQLSVVLLAVLLLILVVVVTDVHPRTDDASVRANLIEIAPEVGGRLEVLPVKDNQFVRQGDLLFQIDQRDYRYALQQALSEQDNLEQRIADAQRKIAAQNNAVGAARAAAHNAATGVKTADSQVDLSKATVARARAAAQAAQAKWNYAQNDLHRLQPLLAKKYVTVDQVDAATTSVQATRGAYDEALAALSEAEAQQTQSILRQQAAVDQAAQSDALLGQAAHVVDTLDILKSQRPALAAKVDRAKLDLERCRVLAPFDAYVTNMDISEGAYARPGTPMFTLIDTRNWWVVANYREGKVKHIRIGDPVALYLMGHPDRKFHGKVESIGFGVLPEDAKVVDGLPSIDRTLNWVHLSTRFPVRVHVDNPDPALFRIGATAVTVVQ